MTADPIKAREWGKAYPAEDITVYYNTRRCVHAAECVRGLPQVFEPGRRPWIRPDLAPPTLLAEVVRRCPSGALHYDLANGPEETSAAPTKIEPLPDGPLRVRGDFVLHTPGGELGETRALLCRCGQSGNKPFCDGTHAKIGWRDGEANSAG